MIVNFELSPSPIEFNRPIAVTVWAAGEGVRMELDDGTVSELAPGGPGVFHGEIASLTGLLNGPQTAIARNSTAVISRRRCRRRPGSGGTSRS